MDRLKQIETFVAVATKGSLTAAAQAEGVALTMLPCRSMTSMWQVSPDDAPRRATVGSPLPATSPDSRAARDAAL